MLTAIGLMLLYIWFRFELQFGLGAVVALFHDLTLSFGLILLLRLEFSLNLIAALLTIIGYSMNDTVVVFDRLRENRRKYKRMPLRDLIDLSVNETLSRTVITGLTALLALSGLAIFGGRVAARPVHRPAVRHRHRDLFVDLRRLADHSAMGRQARRRRGQADRAAAGAPVNRACANPLPSTPSAAAGFGFPAYGVRARCWCSTTRRAIGVPRSIAELAPRGFRRGASPAA